MEVGRRGGGGRERWRWEEEVGGRGGGEMKSGDRIKEGTKRAGNEGEEGLKKR